MKKWNILVLKIKKSMEGTSNGGVSVGYAASICWKEPPMVEGALNLCDMPPRFGGRNLQWWRERRIYEICRLDLVEGSSNGGGSVESMWYAAWWRERKFKYFWYHLQWWRAPWIFVICRLDLVEGSSPRWKKPQITTTSTAIGGSKKVVVEEVTIGCYLNPQNSLCTSP